MKKLKYLLICLMIILCGCSNNQTVDKEVKKVKEEVKPFEEDTCYKYHYQHLTKSQKKLYQELFNIFMNLETSGKVSNKNMRDVQIVHDALLNDHPELFFIETELIYDDYRVEPEYSFKKKEIQQYRKEIEQAKEDILKGLPEGDQYEQMKYLYDYVIESVHYDENSEYNQLLISSLINKNTVCTGYAKMIQYLYQEIGINTTEIIGGSFDENNLLQRHAWNMIEYNNDYYYVDATWGDQEDEERNMALYEYFIFSSEDMIKLYTPEVNYENTTNTDNTYFIKNNLYYTNYNTSSLANAVNKDEKIFQVRFSNDIYDYAKNRIANTNDPFRILSKAGVDVEYINYWYDDNFQVIRMTW